MELTKAETIQMVALITSAYPNHDRFNSEEMIKAMVNVWANHGLRKSTPGSPRMYQEEQPEKSLS